MTNEQILTKAIKKAIKGGWKAQQIGGIELWQDLSSLEQQHVIKLLCESNGDLAEPYRIIIYNHDFAKALWDKPFPGTNIPATFEINLEDIPAWQYHLMQMVVADDPIAYLGENI